MLPATAASPASLDSELALLRTFVSLLEQEQQSLVHGDVDRLTDLIGQKNRIAAELGHFADQRSEMLAASGLAADRAGMAAWLAAQGADSRAFATWSSVLDLAARAHELNRLNGELIETRQQHNSQALEALRNARGGSETYGPDGRSAAIGLRRIRESA